MVTTWLASRGKRIIWCSSSSSRIQVVEFLSAVLKCIYWTVSVVLFFAYKEVMVMLWGYIHSQGAKCKVKGTDNWQGNKKNNNNKQNTRSGSNRSSWQPEMMHSHDSSSHFSKTREDGQHPSSKWIGKLWFIICNYRLWRVLVFSLLLLASKLSHVLERIGN